MMTQAPVLLSLHSSASMYRVVCDIGWLKLHKKEMKEWVVSMRGAGSDRLLALY